MEDVVYHSYDDGYPLKGNRSIWSIRNIGIPLNYICIGIIITLPNAYIEYYPRKLNASDSQLSTITIVRNLPWTFKILYGILADYFPIYGYRFKPYMILGYLLGSISNLWISYTIDNDMSIEFFTILLFTAMLGLIMVDVMADALLTYKAMHEDEMNRGELQGMIYMIRFLTEMVGYWSGSLLSNTDQWGWGFTISQCFCMIAIVPFCMIPFLYMMEEPYTLTVLPIHEQMISIWNMLNLRATWQPLGFLVIYHTLHTYNAAWGNYLQVQYHFSAFEYGSMAAVGSTVGFFGVYIYKKYFLSHGYWHFVYAFASIVIAFFSLANILLIFHLNDTIGLSPYWFALGDSAIMKFAYGVQYLPSAIMFTRVCPPGQEAVAYALLTGFANLAGGFASTISNSLLRIWPVQLEDMQAGVFDGIWKLTILTSCIRLLALPFIPWLLPNTVDELDYLKQPQFNSRLGGFVVVTIYVVGFIWVVVMSILAIVSPCLPIVGGSGC